MAPQAGTYSDKAGAVPPPPGVTPNFLHPAYHAGGIVPLAAVFIPLAAIFMFLRVYTKVRIIKVFGLEDCKFASSLSKQPQADIVEGPSSLPMWVNCSRTDCRRALTYTPALHSFHFDRLSG